MVYCFPQEMHLNDTGSHQSNDIESRESDSASGERQRLLHPIPDWTAPKDFNLDSNLQDVGPQSEKLDTDFGEPSLRMCSFLVSIVL
jgi:hypothetical protein